MKGSLCKIFSDQSLGHEAVLGYQVHSLSSSITSHLKQNFNYTNLMVRDYYLVSIATILIADCNTIGYFDTKSNLLFMTTTNTVMKITSYRRGKAGTMQWACAIRFSLSVP